jgi:hypothetical protein
MDSNLSQLIPVPTCENIPHVSLNNNNLIKTSGNCYKAQQLSDLRLVLKSRAEELPEFHLNPEQKCLNKNGLFTNNSDLKCENEITENIEHIVNLSDAVESGYPNKQFGHGKPRQFCNNPSVFDLDQVSEITTLKASGPSCSTGDNSCHPCVLCIELQGRLSKLEAEVEKMREQLSDSKRNGNTVASNISPRNHFLIRPRLARKSLLNKLNVNNSVNVVQLNSNSEAGQLVEDNTLSQMKSSIFANNDSSVSATTSGAKIDEIMATPKSLIDSQLSKFRKRTRAKNRRHSVVPNPLNCPTEIGTSTLDASSFSNSESSFDESDSTLYLRQEAECLPNGQSENITMNKYERGQCIIIHGLKESFEKFANDRIISDLKSFQNCLETILDGTEFISIIKAFRIGSYNGDSNSEEGHCRPLKVILQSDAQVNLLLKRKYKLKTKYPTVFFQPEYTKKERDKLRQLSLDLKSRRQAGETNLRIVNGEIISTQMSYFWQKPIIMRASCTQILNSL